MTEPRRPVGLEGGVPLGPLFPRGAVTGERRSAAREQSPGEPGRVTATSVGLPRSPLPREHRSFHPPRTQDPPNLRILSPLPSDSPANSLWKTFGPNVGVSVSLLTRMSGRNGVPSTSVTTGSRKRVWLPGGIGVIPFPLSRVRAGLSRTAPLGGVGQLSLRMGGLLPGGGAVIKNT